MLNTFLAWGLGGGRVVGSSGGCSKGITARRAKSWTDSGEKMEQWVGGALMGVTFTQPGAVMSAGLR